MVDAPKILRGSVLVYRVYDVADEVDLAHAERILAPESGKARLRLERSPRQALVMRNAPLRIHLGEAGLSLGGLPSSMAGGLKVDIKATLFDYGVFSICMEIRLPKGLSWTELVSLAESLGVEANASQIDELARRRSGELSQLLKASFKAPVNRELFEDYNIYFLEELEGLKPGVELMRSADFPALIFGEARERLASASREGILENTYQYAENDLVVIDWNSAVVLEPSGQRDIADVLEFTLTHLLEFRYYDDVLDKRLAELYDAVEARRKLTGWRRIWKSQFAGIAQDANSRFIEFSEFIERVDNSLKVVGDFYLAVIFRAAVRRFRIADWQQDATRKMNILARVSELLQGEINVQRGHALEMVIILLIAFEIFSAVLKSL